ncbi:RdgB/HAM1 family non-canonical purine NTP pyrophosphatase [Kangiella sediminilitoris]|uniref:dITP/XTP pyrophosphatase n=1 Tax=Kangiella sediminilitoris TaxID=1144748 RepID=A0A1B3BDH5_9GAMM|nr:RdgB/HAM1 family non-canonical purine NTP pyrophosphatase [Kangiella sediminilitoris]AOE50884.1 Non-canonical purine NTP pyrophosphatase [Kangiella sediminilitoris]
MNNIVLASGNRKKVAELTQLLAQFQYQVIPQTELNVSDVPETGTTFVENAIIKARHAAEVTGLPAIADDSGIEVDYLKGQPGIYSARFCGEHGNDQANNDLLLEKLNGIPPEERTARYQCVLVFMKHASDPTPIICQGTWEGSIMTSEVGNGGFGYDPLFWCEQHQCSAAQLTPQQKAAISHRGKALYQLMQALQSELQ